MYGNIQIIIQLYLINTGAKIKKKMVGALRCCLLAHKISARSAALQHVAFVLYPSPTRTTRWRSQELLRRRRNRTVYMPTARLRAAASGPRRAALNQCAVQGPACSAARCELHLSIGYGVRVQRSQREQQQCDRDTTDMRCTASH